MIRKRLMNVHSRFIHNSQIRKQPKYSSTGEGIAGVGHSVYLDTEERPSPLRLRFLWDRAVQLNPG